MYAKYPMLDAGVVLLVGTWVHVSFDSELAASLHGHEELVPDLTDPATLGCLLALVREAWGDPYLIVRWSGHDWRVVRTDGSVSCWTVARGATEAEALIAALEAAPLTVP